MTWVTREIISPVSEAEHRAVRRAQRALLLPVTGQMDGMTRASLRGIQRLFGLEPTGTLDEKTAAVLDRLRAPGEADEPDSEEQGGG